MKTKTRLLLKLFLIALTIASIAFYVVSITVLSFAWWDFLVLAICIPLISVMVITKLIREERRTNLAKSEEKYIKDIGSAFAGEDKQKKLLLIAIYNFSKKRNKKSLKQLDKLKQRCEKATEHRIVELFRALNYTSMQKNKKAIQVYENAAKNGYISSGMYNNLGHLYAREGYYEEARKNYDLAIFFDPGNIVAYHNMAQLCYKQYEFEKASMYSRKALEINSKFKPSITLLAIIDSIENNKDFDTSFDDVVQMTAEFDVVKIDKEEIT